jgi:phosphoribosylamine--glycine ligase
VLVVGSGGREHALAWKLAQSPKVDRVFVAPGNGGTAKDGKIENAAVSDSDFAGIAKFAKDNQVRRGAP